MLHKYCCHVELSFHTALKYVLLRVLLRFPYLDVLKSLLLPTV